MGFVRQFEPIVYCLYCHERIIRRVSPCGAEEALNVFKKRKFCTSECRGLWERDMNPNPSERAIRHRQKQDMKKAGLWKEKCEICGSGVDVEMHHIDRNPLNGDKTNLQFLCKTCHGKARRGTCTICGADVIYGGGKGYCAMHYARLKRHGDPLVVKRVMQRRATRNKGLEDQALGHEINYDNTTGEATVKK